MPALNQDAQPARTIAIGESNYSFKPMVSKVPSDTAPTILGYNGHRQGSTVPKTLMNKATSTNKSLLTNKYELDYSPMFGRRASRTQLPELSFLNARKALRENYIRVFVKETINNRPTTMSDNNERPGQRDRTNTPGSNYYSGGDTKMAKTHFTKAGNNGNKGMKCKITRTGTKIK